MPSRNESPPSSASRRTRSQWASTSRSRSRSSSTHCPRSRTSPPDDARRWRTSAAVSLVGRPGHRLVDRPRVDQLRQPLALLRGALEWHEEVKQRLPVALRGGFLERARQRAMLHLAAGARARRVGGEEGERMLLVAAVLGQVQAHLADDVPRGVARAQPVRDRTAVSADLVGERAVEVGPARGDPVGVHVLAAVHGRDGAGQPGALVRGAVDFHALAPLLEIGQGAEPGHERPAEVAQERERRGERRVELGRAQVEQRVPGSTPEGAFYAGAGRGGQAVARLVVAGRRVREQRARRQDGHAHRLQSKRRRAVGATALFVLLP